MADLEPGPELDALIAEKVMGWHLDEHGFTWLDADDKPHRGPEVNGPKGERWVFPWNPSGRIEHAWEVVERVEKITKQGVLVEHCSDGERICSVGIHHRGQWIQVCRAVSVTIPHAICLAALKAVGASNG